MVEGDWYLCFFGGSLFPSEQVYFFLLLVRYWLLHFILVHGFFQFGVGERGGSMHFQPVQL